MGEAVMLTGAALAAGACVALAALTRRARRDAAQAAARAATADALAMEARSARREALAGQRAAELEARETRRQLDEAADMMRHIDRYGLMVVTAGHLAYLREEAARADGDRRRAMERGRALELIANGCERPQLVAVQALEQEHAKEVRSWAS